MGINMKDVEEGVAFENAMNKSKPITLTKEAMDEIMKNKKKRPNEDEIVGMNDIVGDK